VSLPIRSWDYAFFRLYLESKDSIDYSGLESYCSNLILQQKINWFPIKKAVIIEGRNKEKKDLPGLFRRLEVLKAVEAQVGDHTDELRQVQQVQREHTVTIKELKDELGSVHRLVDEIRALLLRGNQPSAL
jgi:hypothetical protein